MFKKSCLLPETTYKVTISASNCYNDYSLHSSPIIFTTPYLPLDSVECAEVFQLIPSNSVKSNNGNHFDSENEAYLPIFGLFIAFISTFILLIMWIRRYETRTLIIFILL